MIQGLDEAGGIAGLALACGEEKAVARYGLNRPRALQWRACTIRRFDEMRTSHAC